MAERMEDQEASHKQSAQYGARLMPFVLDKWARDEPDRLYALVPQSARIIDGFDEVTMRQMAHAVDTTASWLIETFGNCKDFQTLAYIGPSDLRYPVLTLAAMKTGWKVCIKLPF